MFRLWAKEFKDNRMLRDTVVCDGTEDTRTHKVFHALDQVCHEFDLSQPVWLDSNIREFQQQMCIRDSLCIVDSFVHDVTSPIR